MRRIGVKETVARYIGEKRVAARYIGENLVFAESEPWYITDGLAHHYDFINNTGDGHDPLAAVWADLAGGVDMDLQNIAFGDRALVFAGNNNAKGIYRGVNLREFTIFNTHAFSALTPLIHPRVFAENPSPTLYAQSGQGYAYAYYGQGLDRAFAPPYIPTVNQIMHTAIRWKGPGNPAELFVDGVQVGQVGPISVYPTATTLKYLGGNSGTTRTFAGEFFEHMVYTKPLTDGEIMHNFVVSKKRYGENE
jgi:hypothetical protein